MDGSEVGWRLSDWLISRDVGFAKRREKYGPPASISKGAGHSIKWTDPQCKGSVEYGDMGMTDKEKLQVCVQALRDVTDPLGRIKRDLREGEKFASSAIVIAQSTLVFLSRTETCRHSASGSANMKMFATPARRYS